MLTRMEKCFIIEQFQMMFLKTTYSNTLILIALTEEN